MREQLEALIAKWNDGYGWDTSARGAFSQAADELEAALSPLPAEGQASPVIDADIRQRMLAIVRYMERYNRPLSWLRQEIEAVPEGQAEARAPTAQVRSVALSFSEGYHAGYEDGLNGDASDSETAWTRSKASASLAEGAGEPTAAKRSHAWPGYVVGDLEEGGEP